MRIQHFRVGMEARQHRIHRQFAQFGRFAPLVRDAFQFGTGNRNDGTVTRMEIHLHGMVNHLEMLQVGGFRKLVSPFHIHIVHQNVFVLSNQLERAGTFHGFLGLLLIVRLFFPFSGSQRTGRGYLDAVAMAFGLIEEMIYSVFEYDIPVDARVFVFRNEKRFRFSFQVREIVIGIRIIDDIRTTGILHGEINHVFSCLLVENGLRRPHPFQLFLSRITLLDIYYRM